MIVQPKIRGFICATSHPVGCEKQVQNQIHYVRQKGAYVGPKRVLVVGASTGYGLSSRVTVAFGSGAATIGVSYDKPASDKRTATAGWYNTAAFEREAQKDGLYAKSIIGDAFSHDIKQQVIDLIRQDLGEIDLLVYSLASPRRIDPDTGAVYSSVLKTLSTAYENQTLDIMSGKLSQVTIGPATETEAADTVKVMGGEDWSLWVEALMEASVLAKGFETTAYSYIGPKLTYDIYRHGTIGMAKAHLEQTAHDLNTRLGDLGHAFVTVCKALVTQASAAIPVVPLYITLLYRLMKDQGVHEGTIEQMDRLMRDTLYGSVDLWDDEARIRMDHLEMEPKIQEAILSMWQQLDQLDLKQVADLEGFRSEFIGLFGFGLKDVDYDADVPVDVPIPSLT